MTMNEFSDSHYDSGTLMIHAIKFPGGYLSEMPAIYTSTLCAEYLSKNPLDAIRLNTLTDSEIEVVNKLWSTFGGLIVVIECNYNVGTINENYKQIERGLLKNDNHY